MYLNDSRNSSMKADAKWKNNVLNFMLLFLVTIASPVIVFSQVEICNNGIDDDNDNLIDLNDDDCECQVIEPVSLIPNPSFEDMNCCPSDRSQLDCASLWIQASEPTTDYIHTCDWLGWDNFPPPQPFPDGEGIMGFRDGRVRNSGPEPYWKEYAGACLLNPLLKDSIYRFQFDVGFVSSQFSPPIDISFFGTANCDYLPFGVGNQDFGCPSNSPNWEKLAEVTVDGGLGDKWVNTFLTIVPDKDIYAIAIGPDCSPVSSPVSLYYFFDNLLLANFDAFDLQISELDHPCSPDYALSVPFNPNFQYQWYLDGIALPGEEDAELSQNYGEGDYQVRIVEGSSCKVSTKFTFQKPFIDAIAYEPICDGSFYQFGDLQLSESGFYIDTFKNIDNCDSIVSLELEVIGKTYDTLQASIFKGDRFELAGQFYRDEGAYELRFPSSIGCDSLVLLELSHFNIYIPNVFSPNRDGINDAFHPFAPANEISTYTMQIFDRWGKLVYEGTSWDGKNEAAGVYTYLIHFEFNYGATKICSGDISLVK